MTSNAIVLSGHWDKGWALDWHVTGSEYIGDDPFGHPRFATTRSEIGELIFQLKYRNNFTAVADIVDCMYRFLQHLKLLSDIDVILAAPSSKDRTYQPVFVIVEELANRCMIPHSTDALVKKSRVQAKNMSYEEKASLSGSVVFTKSFRRPCNVLIIDDIFSSGGTLNACADALRQDPNTKEIYVLTATKTRGD